MAEFNRKFTDEELAKHTFYKRDIVNAIREHATDQFLMTHSLAGPVEKVIKRKTKDALIDAYKLLYETQDLNPDGKKAYLEPTAKRRKTDGNVDHEPDSEPSPKGDGTAPKDEGASRYSEENVSSRTSEGNETEKELDADLCLDDETRRRINSNRVYLITNLNAAPCIDFLQARGLINPDMFDELESKKSNPREQVTSLMFLVGRSTRMFSAFILALQDSNQRAIIDRLSADPSMAAAAQTQHGLLRDIKAMHHLIIENIRFEGSLLTHLEGRRVLTTSQVDELMSISTRRDRAQRLLRLLEKGETEERTRGLVSALYETDQPHLAILIDTGDDSQILSKQVKEGATRGKVRFIEGIRDQAQRLPLPHVLSRLEADGTITSAQSEAVQAVGSPELQYQQLFDTLICRPLSVVRQCISRETETSEVTFHVPALEGSSGQGQPSVIDAIGTYLQKLKSAVKDATIEKNQRLNESFGIQLDTVLYCDLAMASQMTGMPNENAGTSAIEEYIRRTAESLKIKDSVSMDNVFALNTEEQRKGRPNRVLLLGGAGMGKTTVLQELSRRWSEGALNTPKVLACYRFECRNFTDDIKKSKEFSLADLLYKRHPPSNISGDEKAALVQLINDKESDIMIAIDGLDELAGWKSCEHRAPEIYDVTESGEIHHVLYNLIRGNLLPEAKVLVTSRPTASVKQKDFVSCLVALGFSEASIKECMKTLCKTEELAQLVIDYIYRTNLVADCIVPLTCVLLGVVLRRDLAQESGGQPPSSEINSMTRLYSRVSTECIWRRDEDKDHADMLSDLIESQKASFLKLAKLASHGMFGEETVVVFDNSDLAAVDMRADGEWFGLLEVSLTGGPSRDYKRPCTASFLHLTVEEFLAAVHLALTWDPALLNTLAGTESQRLNMVAMFVCGLLGDSEGRKFIKALSPRFSDQNAESRCKEILKYIEPRSKEDKLARLQYLRCVSEGRLGGLVPETQGTLLVVEHGLQTLNFDSFPGGLLPHHLAAVGYGAQFTQLASLSLYNCQITSQGVQALERSSPNLTSLKKLMLYTNSLGDAGVEALVNLLVRNKKLEYLDLQSNKISDAGVAHLAGAVRNLQGLETLNLDYNKISDRGAELLAGAVRDHTGIETLTLGLNKISDRGAELLAVSLQKHPSMQRLDLRYNQITEEGTKGLAAALRANHAIEELRIYNNKLSEARKSGLKEEFKDRIRVKDYTS